MLCYLPYFLAPLQHGGLSNWWKLQLDMYRFQANLRTSIAFGKPEISIYYLFADDGPDSLAAGNQVE